MLARIITACVYALAQLGLGLAGIAHAVTSQDVELMWRELLKINRAGASRTHQASRPGED
jgi:hypothetical protein